MGRWSTSGNCQKEEPGFVSHTVTFSGCKTTSDILVTCEYVPGCYGEHFPILLEGDLQSLCRVLQVVLLLKDNVNG